MQLTMRCAMLAAVMALLAVLPAEANRQRAVAKTAINANPIRKVVNMLQAMQKKVTEEGEKEKELYEKFMCYCRSGKGDLQASISSAETKAPSLSSSIESSEGLLVQTKGSHKQSQEDRTAAKDAMAEATALREKEAAAYAKEKAEYETNIAAINSAVTALEKGMAGSFLQTSAAEALRRVLLGKQDMLDVDRQEVLAFLSSKQSSDYAPKGGEITGLLKEMGDSMSKSLAKVTADEEASIKSYDELMAAKSKEVAALSSSVEAKTKQIGELGVQIVQMKEDLTDTEAALLEDKQFLADTEKSCATKTAEWEERSKTRADELVALAETIKVLNDDDALDLFKKTLPSASSSFMQVQASAWALRTRVLGAIGDAQRVADKKDRAGLDFIALALAGKKALSRGGFDKVIKMIDNMVDVLKKEQDDDDHKKEYCAKQLDVADDKKKALERTVSEEEHSIAMGKEGIATLTEEIAVLEAGVKALDKSVAEATEQRKKENAEYKDLMASDAAAKELLLFAKNRLSKFYNPKLHKPAAKAELSEEDRIAVNIGGTAPPTPAPGGIAGTGVTVLAQVRAHAGRSARGRDAPAPPPETWGAYSKKSEESTGVVAMLDLLIKDLEKELVQAKTEEKDAQADYEKTMQDSAVRRSTDSKSLSSKMAAKADLEEDVTAHEESKTSAGKELMATFKYIQSLHSECDWLLQYFDMRKEARASEVDSLKRAKSILSGADYSFLQTKTSGLLGGH